MFEIHHYWALLVMGLAGVLGAGVTEAIAWTGATPVKAEGVTLPSARRRFWRVVVLGLAAAAAVPVFLSIASTGSENLLITKVFYSTGGLSQADAVKAGSEFVSKLVLLASFCVIAGFAAQRLFETLATQLLRRVENSEKTANAALDEAAKAKADAETLKKQAEAAKAAADLAKAEAEKAKKETAEIKARTIALDRALDATVQSQQLLAEAVASPQRVTRAVTGEQAKNLVLDQIRAIPFRAVARSPGSLALELNLGMEQVEQSLKELAEEGAVEERPLAIDPARLGYSLAQTRERDVG
jgi:hypothetical protein